ncbi:MAG: ERF superfamily protein [Caudoviricetes sp.]|nr:MAG: ERF superfamily protein [Caudoviricetes sp.]
MNVYQKLAEARQKLKDAGLKQSGKNKGVGYTYFDLADILPQTTKLEKDLGMLSVVSFSDDEGTLTIYNTEDANEKIVFTSPLRGAELRGCHPVQNLGAAETYVRRYLYLLAYEIVETESLDLQQGTDQAQCTRSKTVQAVESAVEEERRKKQELSKARKIQELIKGTGIQAEEITKWIENNLGASKKVNDLTDDEFKKLYSALERAIREDVA